MSLHHRSYTQVQKIIRRKLKKKDERERDDKRKRGCLRGSVESGREQRERDSDIVGFYSSYYFKLLFWFDSLCEYRHFISSQFSPLLSFIIFLFFSLLSVILLKNLETMEHTYRLLLTSKFPLYIFLKKCCSLGFS